MATTKTTLSAAVSDNSATRLPVTASTGATVGGFCLVDREYSVITATGTGWIDVRSRGDYGGRAVAHNILAPVVFGLQSDLPNTAPGEATYTPLGADDIQSYGVSGAIDPTLLTGQSNTVYLTKATAAAMTLVGPGKGQTGMEVKIVSLTAAAHTVTYTAGFSANTTSSDVATFAATVGAAMTIKALPDGTWAAIAAVGVTIA